MNHDRPGLYRPRLGLVGYVPESATKYTVAQLMDLTATENQHRPDLNVLNVGRYPRICFYCGVLAWHPWGRLRDIGWGSKDSAYPNRRGHIQVHRPGARTGVVWIIGGERPLSEYDAWVWGKADEAEVAA